MYLSMEVDRRYFLLSTNFYIIFEFCILCKKKFLPRFLWQTSLHFLEGKSASYFTLLELCPHVCGLLKQAVKKIVASSGLRGWVCSQKWRIVLWCCRSCFESKHQDKFRAVLTSQSSSTQMHINIHTSVWLADDSQVFYMWYLGDATLAIMASTNISLFVVGRSNALICSSHWGLRQLLITIKNEVLCQ